MFCFGGEFISKRKCFHSLVRGCSLDPCDSKINVRIERPFSGTRNVRGHRSVATQALSWDAPPLEAPGHNVKMLDQSTQRKQFWMYLYENLGNEANVAKIAEAKAWASSSTDACHGPDINGAVYQNAIESRGFVACVFCAMQHWSEQLVPRYLTGPHCTIKSPAAVADLLSVEWYSEQWPLIPKGELEASAVDFPYQCISVKMVRGRPGKFLCTTDA